MVSISYNILRIEFSLIMYASYLPSEQIWIYEEISSDVWEHQDGCTTEQCNYEIVALSLYFETNWLDAAGYVYFEAPKLLLGYSKRKENQ